MRSVAAAWLLALSCVAAQTIKPGCLPPAPPLRDLWCPGENNYTCYKIPSLLRVPTSGALLGFIEGRKYSCADDGGHVDVLLKRSTDGGKTWSAASTVYSNSTDAPRKEWHTIGDALPLWDAATSTVHLVFTRDNSDVFYTRSTDEGASWAPPRNVSAGVVVNVGRSGTCGMAQPNLAGTCFCGTGHASGLQLQSGRLLIPMYGCGRNKPFVLTSADHGATWQVSGGIACAPNEWDFAPATASLGDSATLLASIRAKGYGGLPSVRLQARLRQHPCCEFLK